MSETDRTRAMEPRGSLAMSSQGLDRGGDGSVASRARDALALMMPITPSGGFSTGGRGS